MYNSDPALLYLCKIKFGEKLPNGDVYLDPSMPWTVTGKRTRGLENDALGRMLQQLLHAGTGALQTAADEIGVGLDSETTHPAGPAVTPNRRVTQSVREDLRLMPQGSPAPIDGSIIANTGTNKLLVAGAVAFGVWYFLIREPARSVSGFGGYRKRRRSRRLRLR
jgi:hypothetical protein